MISAVTGQRTGRLDPSSHYRREHHAVQLINRLAGPLSQCVIGSRDKPVAASVPVMTPSG
jgi:hypothetical protein